MRLLSTLLVFSLCYTVLQAQSSKDATVPLVATFTLSPATVTLNWPNPDSANILVQRRTKGQGSNSWVQIINETNSKSTTLTDNNLVAGQIYEYYIKRTMGSLNAYGYAHVALNANPVNTRGKILIFVDSTTADALGVELVRLKNDMRGDGWWPIPFHTGPSSTVQSIKNQIIASYNADPTNVKAVLMLGSVPIPYSGNAAWDGHGDHQGAWPSDAYYADINGNWTDATVNNITPSRMANVNIPGDGKFDQSYLPSVAELQIGRVDFRRINAPAFGAADQIGLMKRYLDKDHNWRIGAYTVENKALVDDNFGYFSGEAFASNGYRNAYPLVGEANIVATDFFDGTESQSYLLGYGCGGGNYNGAGGVGSSSNFATDSVNIVFSNLFGSYFGDWDYESDPFMPSALASRGGILTCSWAGRPHGFNQALASGETIGYCNKETMNAQFNASYVAAFGKGGAHVALLGDPTLRAHVVKPATNLTLSNQNCQSVVLNWTTSADAVDGYLIYRAPSQDGPYALLTTNLISGSTFTDNSPVQGTQFYQVRAIKNVTTPGGGTYANNSIGPIKSIEFTSPPQVNATVNGALNCSNQSLQLESGNNDPVATFAWTGPNNFASTLSSPTVSVAGTYVVVVTLGVCTVTDELEVVQAPDLAVTFDPAVADCDGAFSICVQISGGTPPYNYLWSNGSTAACTTVITPGGVNLSISDQGGCSFQSANIIINTPPQITILFFVTNETAPNANNGAVVLAPTGGSGSFVYLWSNGATTKDLVGLSGGTYTVTVTDLAGCTATVTIVVNTTSSTAETELFEQFLLSPNPTNGLASLSLKLREAAALRVEVRDVAGRLIWENPSVQTDALNLPIDLTQSPAGMYTISVWVENLVFVRKLALVR